MNNDKIIRMAREAGVYTDSDDGETFLAMPETSFERFYQMAFAAGAAHEREACAKVCAEGWKEGIGAKHQGDVFAVAIRAREEA